MKLLCDEMLKGLCRWLRAAGYDAEQASEGENDRNLLAQARTSGRVLVTRDRKLQEHRGAAGTLCLLTCNGVDACALELTEKLGIDWLHRPFSRCLICNIPLQPLPRDAGDSVPADVCNQPLLCCPECKRIYWKGSHVRRMQEKLQGWATSGCKQEILPMDEKTVPGT